MTLLRPLVEGKHIVADNGPGIPKDARTKLFEPFYTTKREKGTGLGLWITRQLVQKHGGVIKFKSWCGTARKEGGTVFSIWLTLIHEFLRPVGTPDEERLARELPMRVTKTQPDAVLFGMQQSPTRL